MWIGGRKTLIHVLRFGRRRYCEFSEESAPVECVNRALDSIDGYPRETDRASWEYRFRNQKGINAEF